MTLTSVPVLAGIISTVIFASSTLPMLGKALRTRDLGSYSLGNLVLANVGNAVHSVYVFSLAPGPLWILHSFNQLSTGAMFVWFVRYELLPRRQREQKCAARSPLGPNMAHTGSNDKTIPGQAAASREQPLPA